MGVAVVGNHGSRVDESGLILAVVRTVERGDTIEIVEWALAKSGSRQWVKRVFLNGNDQSEQHSPVSFLVFETLFCFGWESSSLRCKETKPNRERKRLCYSVVDRNPVRKKKQLSITDTMGIFYRPKLCKERELIDQKYEKCGEILLR